MPRYQITNGDEIRTMTTRSDYALFSALMNTKTSFGVYERFTDPLSEVSSWEYRLHMTANGQVFGETYLAQRFRQYINAIELQQGLDPTAWKYAPMEQ